MDLTIQTPIPQTNPFLGLFDPSDQDESEDESPIATPPSPTRFTHLRFVDETHSLTDNTYEQAASHSAALAGQISKMVATLDLEATELLEGYKSVVHHINFSSTEEKPIFPGIYTDYSLEEAKQMVHKKTQLFIQDLIEKLNLLTDQESSIAALQQILSTLQPPVLETLTPRILDYFESGQYQPEWFIRTIFKAKTADEFRQEVLLLEYQIASCLYLLTKKEVSQLFKHPSPPRFFLHLSKMIESVSIINRFNHVECSDEESDDSDSDMEEKFFDIKKESKKFYPFQLQVLWDLLQDFDPQDIPEALREAFLPFSQANSSEIISILCDLKGACQSKNPTTMNIQFEKAARKIISLRNPIHAEAIIGLLNAQAATQLAEQMPVDNRYRIAILKRPAVKGAKLS